MECSHSPVSLRFKYAPLEKDHDIRSEVTMAHQRGGERANMAIEWYLESGFPKPVDFRDFLYLNHVMQGDAIKTAIEAHRRNMPYTMGSLFWQHNECWPVASWSSRDYYFLSNLLFGRSIGPVRRSFTVRCNYPCRFLDRRPYLFE